MRAVRSIDIGLIILALQAVLTDQTCLMVIKDWALCRRASTPPGLTTP
ncbi:hypothetical protein D2E25_0098 [Bifidobacterium goeldii]|uniref:Uncharacterized protein n=1 Tax=Bifidobacterium goeldii TaxID=2306975 RepID=A0A430FM48_9BIFI|nr:hypothetical protein D2E25_0098 [Bifidobacterium goeldii]